MHVGAWPSNVILRGADPSAGGHGDDPTLPAATVVVAPRTVVLVPAFTFWLLSFPRESRATTRMATARAPTPVMSCRRRAALRR